MLECCVGKSGSKGKEDGDRRTLVVRWQVVVGEGKKETYAVDGVESVDISEAFN